MTADQQLTELRGSYEPFVNALAQRFLFSLPAFVPDKPAPDNWQSSAWMPRVSPFGNDHQSTPRMEHFD